MLRPSFALLLACSAVLAQSIFAADHSRLRQLLRPSQSKKAAPPSKEYTFYQIAVPDGFFAGFAVDINNRRTVGGVFYSNVGQDVTFTWTPGAAQPTIITKPGEAITSVPSITDSGVLFGNWGNFTQQTAGFYDPATNTWTALPPFPGKSINIGQRSNNSGRATGYACNGNWFAPEDCVNWIWNGKSYEVPQLPASPVVIIEGINEVGKIVGRYMVQPPFDFRSFILDGASTTILLPDTKSAALDINNRSEVAVNYEAEPNAVFVPGILRNNQLTASPLFPGGAATSYTGINERGDFSGAVGYLDGQGQLSPPIPAVAIK